MRRSALLLGFALAILPAACNKNAPKGGATTGSSAVPVTKQQPAHDTSGLLATLKGTTPEKHRRALEMAREMDEQGNDPVPVLIEAMKDPACGALGTSHEVRPTSTRETAVLALLELKGKGKKALIEQGIPALEKGLRDAKPEVREHTVNAIGMIGPEAKSASEAVCKLCADSNKDVRSTAYRVLQKFKSFPPAPILRYLMHPDLGVAGEAAAALAWIKPTGADAVPLLLEAIKREPKLKQEPSDVIFIKNAAAEALANVGKGAESAVPALIEMLVKAKKEDVEAMAKPAKPGDTATNLSGPVLALRKIGKPAAEAVIPLLKAEQPIVRFQAAAVLSGMNPSEAAVALPAVQAAMEAERELPNWEQYAFEEEVAATLNLGGDAEKVLTQITDSLRSDNEVVRLRTARVLARLGRKAAPAVPKLVELLNDKFTQIQIAALEALAAIGPTAAKDCVTEVAKKVEGMDIGVAREATKTLKAFGPAAAPGVPALAKALDSNERYFCIEAAEALTAIGPEAVAAVESIVKHLGDANANREERLALLQATAAVGPPAKDAIPTLAKLLGEKETAIRVAAAETLGKVGAGNESAIKSLTAPLADQKNTPFAMQSALLRALASMGPAGKSATGDVKAYAEAANDPAAKIWAAGALMAFGVEVDANSKLVLAALKEKAPTGKSARGAAVDAAEFLGAKGKSAVPDLLEILQDKGQPSTTRERAARTLGKLGPQAKDAIKPLTDCLKEKDKGLQRAAADGLGSMGPDAVVAVPKLRELLKSDIADAAQAALDKIEPEKK
jgi:HEAT repeat protein